MGDAQRHMSLVGDGGGEEELWHVRSGGCPVTHVPSGGWGWRGGPNLFLSFLNDMFVFYNVILVLCDK